MASKTIKKFVIYPDKAHEYRWRAIAFNNQIVGASADGYRNQGDCEDGVKLMQGSAGAPVEVESDEESH